MDSGCADEVVFVEWSHDERSFQLVSHSSSLAGLTRISKVQQKQVSVIKVVVPCWMMSSKLGLSLDVISAADDSDDEASGNLLSRCAAADSQ